MTATQDVDAVVADGFWVGMDWVSGRPVKPGVSVRGYRWDALAVAAQWRTLARKRKALVTFAGRRVSSTTLHASVDRCVHVALRDE